MITKIDFEKGKVFRLKKEKILNGENTEKKYSYTFSESQTLAIYKSIVSSLPKWKGLVVVYGKNERVQPVSCVYSDNNLREKFSNGLCNSSNGQIVDRFHWMLELLMSGQYKELTVCASGSWQIN